METRITQILGIAYPIFQGGMAWVAEWNLASAVSKAGGLGIIGAGGAPASFVREQIRKVKEVTDRPFGVNLMLMNPEADAIARVIVEEQVPVVTTGAGNPGKYMALWSGQVQTLWWLRAWRAAAISATLPHLHWFPRWWMPYPFLSLQQVELQMAGDSQRHLCWVRKRSRWEPAL